MCSAQVEGTSARPLALRRVTRVPWHCVWEVTNACNLDCVHCESASGRPRPDELTGDEALGLCADLKAIGCRTVNLSGGEPFLRPDWAAIGERLIGLGLEPIVVSNLTLLTNDHVATMERIGIKSVATSVDGPAAIHDRIRLVRGAGGSPFARTVAALQTLKARGFFLSAITHVNLWNIATLDDVAELLEGIGVDHWQVQVGFPQGRLREVAASYMIYPHQLEEVCRFIKRVRERGRIRLAAGDNIGYFGPDELVVREKPGTVAFWQGCPAGYLVLSIASNGDVGGCPSLPIVAGSIRQRPLREIWEDEALYWYNSRWDENRLTGRCRLCPYRRICRGGCKSMALATTGSVYRNIYCLNQLQHLGGDPRRREDHGRPLP